MENNQDIKALFRRYLENQCTAEELEFVFSHLKTPEGVEQMQEIMDKEAIKAFRSPQPLPPVVSEEIFANLQSSISKSNKGRNQQPDRRFYMPALWKMAACFIGLLFLGGLSYQLYTGYQTVSYTTGPGQKQVIILPDHTTVTLNAGSSLTYPRNWQGAQTREVNLEGEAFFDVVRNEQQPFIVKTSKIEVRVLGTSFNVKSYREDETIETTLVKGKVLIHNPDRQAHSRENVALAPNQKAIFSKKSSLITLATVKPELYTSWRKGKLIFEDESFREIAKALERWYGVKFLLNDEAAGKCRFSAKIEHESLNEVLNLFKASAAVSFTIEGKEVTVQGKLCDSR